jgi:predicted RNA-binding Zn ribbon-like protein
VNDSTSASGASFPFHHGRIALSFAGTVRDRESERAERIHTPALLADWLVQAGLLARGPQPSAALHRRALELREAIARTFRNVVDGVAPARDDVAMINAVARRWAPRPALDAATLALATDRPASVQDALGRIAADAIASLCDPEERSRLRSCGADACGAIFLTPAGRRERRWCSMARCGNRAKVAAFRSRSHSPEV